MYGFWSLRVKVLGFDDEMWCRYCIRTQSRDVYSWSWLCHWRQHPQPYHGGGRCGVSSFHCSWSLDGWRNDCDDDDELEWWLCCCCQGGWLCHWNLHHPPHLCTLSLILTLIHPLEKYIVKGFVEMKIFLLYLSLIHIWRCRRYSLCRSRWSPYH